VDRVASGEEIVIAKHEKPRAKLVPMLAANKQEPRTPSNTLGLTYMSDDFDAPLPPELLKLRKPSGAMKIKWISPDFDDPLPPELLKQFGYDP
jgi:antitoxin (DNA-binding transcriptional repressor) of toxin-antitoxin stability system